MRRCPQCGALFDPRSKRSGNSGKPPVYCSQDCRVEVGGSANNTPRPERICDHCGSSFRPGSGGGTVYRFCSQACYWASIRRPEPGLPQHVALIPLVTCDECWRPMLPMAGRGRPRVCHPMCQRQRGSRTSGELIKKRYREEPEFRAKMILYSKDRLAQRLGFRDHAEMIDWLRHKNDGVCGICGEPVPPDPCPRSEMASPDHIVPKARGGSDDEVNLQLSHLRCNLWKRDRLQSELVEST